jgi:hypothetical protein
MSFLNKQVILSLVPSQYPFNVHWEKHPLVIKRQERESGRLLQFSAVVK